MDWNTKWDWENLALFNLKTETPKQKTTDWGIVEGEEIMGSGPFRLYEGKGSSSGSELAPGSSARSSISVCTDSAFENINAFSGEKESPPAVEYSVGSGESLIGLKLGKRMYFENNRFGSSSTKTASLPQVPVSSTVKKIKLSNLNNPRCQVEGCNLDLSSAKEYHRKHKVCASHSKYPKVVVAGVERRFCQQCSRFHSLSEFDEKKRSCRRRLSDHNARRRKPQLEPMQFNTMRLPSPLSAFACTDGRRQISFASNAPHNYSRSFSDSTKESLFSSKYTPKKEYLLEFGKIGGLDEQLQSSGTQLPHTISLPDQSFNRLVPPKGAKSETSPRGFKESVLPPNLDSAPDFNRALSLLSNDSWSSFSLSNNSREHSMSIDPMHPQPLMQGFPQSFPQSSLEFCQTDHCSTDSLTATANDIGHFQLFKAPYENSLYSNLFN